MRKATRSKKINDGNKPPTRAKFTQEGVAPTDGSVMSAAIKLEPSNANQKQMLSYLREGRKVVIAQGSAGTGKSYIAAYHGATLMRQKRIDKIVLVRANVSVGKSLGMLPGTIEEKLAPFFTQTIAHLETFMGRGHVKYCLEKSTIVMQSMEHMRGHSVENALIIVEESQGITSDEFEMILTRIGEGTQIIFTGDQRQSDLKGVHGLSSTIAMIEKALDDEPEYLSDDELDEFHNNIGIVTFTPDDVVRSGICKAFVKLYYYK